MSVDAFDSAEFYDCFDSESLTHGTPEEAVEAWVDFWMDRDADITAVIREHAPCTVTAYRAEEIGEKWIQGLAESLLKRTEESLVEYFGNPNDYDDECISDADLKACLPAMVCAVQRVVSHFHVRRCEPVATRTLNADQIEAMMREYCPYWFESKTQTQNPPEKAL